MADKKLMNFYAICVLLSMKIGCSINPNANYIGNFICLLYIFANNLTNYVHLVRELMNNRCRLGLAEHTRNENERNETLRLPCFFSAAPSLRLLFMREKVCTFETCIFACVLKVSINQENKQQW